MKKSSLYLLIAVAIILTLSFSFYSLTGFHTLIKGKTTGCSDTDGGLNYYEKGTASYANRDYSYTDYCVREAKVKEYYCNAPNTSEAQINSKKEGCPNGCKDGACIK